MDTQKSILMTRRELVDPFGSDEEEDPLPPPVASNKCDILNKVNGEINVNGDNKVKDDVFADLPKPNPVSNKCDLLFGFCFTLSKSE